MHLCLCSMTLKLEGMAARYSPFVQPQGRNDAGHLDVEIQLY